MRGAPRPATQSPGDVVDGVHLTNVDDLMFVGELFLVVLGEAELHTPVLAHHCRHT